MELVWPSRSLELPGPLGEQHLSNSRLGKRVVWPTPLALLPFGPSPAWGSRDFPKRPPPSAEAGGRQPSWSRPLLQSARVSAGTALRWFLLSWDSVHPTTGVPGARPLPGTEAPFGPALPDAGSRSAFVVSHHHDGFLRAEVTGLLHPATGQGFAAFHVGRPCRPKAGRRGTIPATRFEPFEDFPSPAAGPHHCGRCQPVVTVLPGAVPAEAGAIARRRLPKRVAYPRPLPGVPEALPRRAGSIPGDGAEPRERGRPCSEERGAPALWRAHPGKRRAVLRRAPIAGSLRRGVAGLSRRVPVPPRRSGGPNTSGTAHGAPKSAGCRSRRAGALPREAEK